MQYKKKTCSSAGTPEQAGTNTACRATSFPAPNSTAKIPGRQEIAVLLGHGQDAAVPLAQLVNMTGRDGRTVRLMIERERRSGIPILSDCKSGYYLAADEVEAARFVASMRHRAHEILTTASAIERAAGMD